MTRRAKKQERRGDTDVERENEAAERVTVKGCRENRMTRMCMCVRREREPAENKSGIKKTTEEEGRQLCDCRLREQDEAKRDCFFFFFKNRRLVIATGKKGG